MGIAGAGYGAATALEQIMARQMLEAQMRQRQEMAQQQLQMQQESQKFNQDRVTRIDAQNAEDRTLALDERATGKRALSNMAGMRDFEAAGMDPRDIEREVEGVALQGGVNVPQSMQARLGRAVDDQDFEQAIQGVPDRVRQVAGLRRRGVNVSGDDLMTPEEQQAAARQAEDDAVRRASRIAAAQRGPSQTAPKYERIEMSDGTIQFLTADEVREMGGVRGKSAKDGPTDYSMERAERTIASVDELLSKVGRSTVGAASLLSSVPESSARNFRAELDTLKANIAFNELTAMREASKTGGALGQVSNIELGLLQSALGALDQGQSPENLKAQLEKIKASVERWKRAVGGDVPAGPGAPPMGRTGGDRVDDLLKKYGGG